jgi:hypothetical protein
MKLLGSNISLLWLARTCTLTINQFFFFVGSSLSYIHLVLFPNDFIEDATIFLINNLLIQDFHIVIVSMSFF